MCGVHGLETVSGHRDDPVVSLMLWSMEPGFALGYVRHGLIVGCWAAFGIREILDGWVSIMDHDLAFLGRAVWRYCPI
jgi:hypothetical protein